MKTNNANNNNPAGAKSGNTTNARFIELLNLCVDDQLTPAEADELDAALLANPARRRTYEQYCRMSQACAQLFGTRQEKSEERRVKSEKQADGAEAPFYSSPFALHSSYSPALARALADAERKIQNARTATRSASRSSHSTASRPFFTFWRGLFAFGGLAALGAAAAIALILHTRAPDASPANANASITATPPRLVTTILTTDQTPSSAVASADQNTATESVALVASYTASPTGTVTALVMSGIQSMARRFHFPTSVTTFSGDNPQSLAPDDSAVAWTKDIQLRPIRKVSPEAALETLTRLALPQISSTIIPLPAAAREDADEMSAFQFHK